MTVREWTWTRPSLCRHAKDGLARLLSEWLAFKTLSLIGPSIAYISYIYLPS